MSMKVAELVAELGLDMAPAEREMRAGKAKINKAAHDIGDDAGKTVAKGVTDNVRGIDWSKALVIGAGFGAAAMGIKSVFDSFSDRQESVSKVGVVFKGMSNDIQSFAANAPKAMGMSTTAALEAAGTLGNLFSAMKIGEGDSANMSKSMIQLASDLASFNNANPEDVLLALRSGLVGETEPLRTFGVNLNEARIRAEAFRLGLAKSDVDMAKVEKTQIDVTKAQQNYTKAVEQHGVGSLEAAEAANKIELAQNAVTKAMEGSKVELDAGAKAQAAYSLIMADTALAQGDFARTADGAANKQRIMQAELENTKVKLGEAVAPLANFSLELLLGALNGLNGWWDEKGPGIRQWIKDTFGEDPGASFRTGIDLIKTKLDEFRASGELAAADFERGQERIRTAIAGDKEPMDALVDGARRIRDEFLDPAWGGIQDFWDKLFGDRGLKGKVLDPIIGTIQTVSRNLDDLADNRLFRVALGAVGVNVDGLDGARAAGGPVWPHGSFLVGENGPEVFRPSTAGEIISEDDPRWNAQTMGNGTGWHNNQYFRGGQRDVGPEWLGAFAFAGVDAQKKASMGAGSKGKAGTTHVYNITVNSTAPTTYAQALELKSILEKVTR